MKALRNANFNKIQISSATDKEQQIQKLNTILEKEQGMKKIMAKYNIELKAQNQSLQTKMQETKKSMMRIWKYFEKLKKNCRIRTKSKISNLKDYLEKRIKTLRPH